MLRSRTSRGKAIIEKNTRQQEEIKKSACGFGRPSRRERKKALSSKKKGLTGVEKGERKGPSRENRKIKTLPVSLKDVNHQTPGKGKEGK